MPLFSAATAARLKAIRQDGFDTIRMFHDDTFACWETDRGVDWADDGSAEGQRLVVSGTGRLYEHGPGGDVSGENVIHVESPYRFRTLADAAIEPGNLLVINETRLFRVESTKPEDTDDRLMNVYLMELFNTPMPEEP